MRRLEIILNNFSLANVILRQVHLVFMKMYMFGIVSTTNKRLAGTGGGGGGSWVRVQTGAMEKFGVIFIPLDQVKYKLIEFFLPVITTGFDRKKYSWKNFSLEGRGILSHVEAMLTGPE